MSDCFIHTGSEASLDARLDAGVESGRFSLREADIVREFAAFLRAAGTERPIRLEVLREYQEFLNISDEELAQIEISRCPRHRQSSLGRTGYDDQGFSYNFAI